MANLFIGIGGSGVKTMTAIISKSVTKKNYCFNTIIYLTNNEGRLFILIK